MIPARIISIDNKVMVKGHKLQEPEKFDPSKMIYEEQVERWKRSVIAYEESEFIAEVEISRFGDYNNLPNIMQWKGDFYYNQNNYLEYFIKLKIGQSYFIDPTSEGKCKIVKI
jgi:hypothetical protein